MQTEANSTIKNKLSADDLIRFKLISSPTASSDGRHVASLVETVREDLQGYDNAIWLFSLDAQPQEIISEREAKIHLPRFAPQGPRLAFVSTVQGMSTLKVLNIGNGVIKTLRTFDGEVGELEWVDENRIALILNRNPRDEFISNSQVVKISWLHYKKDGNKDFSQLVSELWIIGPNDNDNDNDNDKLIYSAGSHLSHLACSADKVAFVVEPRHCNEVERSSKVFCFNPTSEEFCGEWDFKGLVEDLAVTNLTSNIIAIAPFCDKGSTPVSRLFSLTSNGRADPMFASEDISCEFSVQGDTRPTTHGRLIKPVLGSDDFIFAATTEGDTALFLSVTPHKTPARITPKGLSATDFSASAHGVTYVALESNINPIELYQISLDQPPQRQIKITDLNGWLKEYLVHTNREMITLVSDDQLELNASFYPAETFSPSGLIVRIHGGPHLCYGNGFDLETQIALANGYSVLLPNIRGSSGLGYNFRKASIGNWGNKDYEDLISLVDHLIIDSRIDPDRVFLQGASYGGYLTNMALTKTNRFRAAISERSVSNLISKYGTSDNGFTTNKLELNQADLFDETLAELINRSPLFSADSIITPLMLIHGEKDFRCPIEQSEQLFVALRRLQKEVVFCRFPEESHNISYSGRPDHRIARLHLIMDWFAEHQ